MKLQYFVLIVLLLLQVSCKKDEPAMAPPEEEIAQCIPLEEETPPFHSIQNLPSGGHLYASGWSLTKVDEQGNPQWTQDYLPDNPSNRFSLLGVAPDHDGGLVLYAGELFQNSALYRTNFYIIKTDSNGNVLWTKRSGQLWGYRSAVTAIHPIPEGGYLLEAYIDEKNDNTSAGGNTDIYLARLDENGNELWHKTLGEEGVDEEINFLQVLPGGDFYMVGTNNPEDQAPLYLSKFDPEGNELEQKIIVEGGANQVLSSVQKIDEEGLLLSGHLERSGQGMFLARLDLEGNELWYKTFAEGNGNYQGAVYIPQEGFVLYGSICCMGQFNRTSAFLVKTDLNGNEIWDKTYDSSPAIKEIEVTSTGRLIIAADYGFGPTGTYYLIQLESDGTETSLCRFGAPAHTTFSFLFNFKIISDREIITAINTFNLGLSFFYDLYELNSFFNFYGQNNYYFRFPLD